jgi:hypothetical protein
MVNRCLSVILFGRDNLIPRIQVMNIWRPLKLVSGRQLILFEIVRLYFNCKTLFYAYTTVDGK